MKRIRPILVLVALAAFTLSGVTIAANRSIVDYYRLIPEEFLTGSRYNLRQEGGLWKTNSFTDQALNPVVDIPNGYLRINDPGTGGGTLTQELAVFLDANKKAIIGLNVFQFDGVGMEGSLRFFTEEKGALVDCTARVMPPFGPRLFFADAYQTKLKTIERLGSLCPVIFSLPRQGTTITAMISTARLDMALANAEPGTPEKKRFDDIKKNIGITAIELPWNAGRGVFTMGQKKKR